MIFDKIERLCKQKNIAIRKVELDCGLSNGSITKWRNVIPSAASLYKVAKYLGVTVEQLLEKEDQ